MRSQGIGHGQYACHAPLPWRRANAGWRRSIEEWCREAKSTLGSNEVQFAVQTNGVLVDDRWADVFSRYAVCVGVSVDGPPHVHDQHRVDHLGRASYSRVLAGIERLRSAGVPWSVLSVIALDHEPVMVHRHLVDEVGATTLDTCRLTTHTRRSERSATSMAPHRWLIGSSQCLTNGGQRTASGLG